MDKAQTPKELAIAEYRVYLRIKNELHEVARRFLLDIRSKAPDRIAEADRIVVLIVHAWRHVRPYGAPQRIGWDPFEELAEIFNPSLWVEVDAAPLHAALFECGEAYKRTRTRYKKLTLKDGLDAFPNGLKP